jgi:hypothetical protein
MFSYSPAAGGVGGVGGGNKKHRKPFVRALLPRPSEWTAEISFDSVGSSAVLHLKGLDGSLYDVGVEFAAGQGVMRRTVMITFYPHITLVNQLPLPIQLRQYRDDHEKDINLSDPNAEADDDSDEEFGDMMDNTGEEKHAVFSHTELLRALASSSGKTSLLGAAPYRFVPSNKLTPFFWPRSHHPFMLSFRTLPIRRPEPRRENQQRDFIALALGDEDEENEEDLLNLEEDFYDGSMETYRSDWSGFFQATNAGDFGLLVRNSKTNESFIARIEIAVQNSRLFITLSLDNSQAPPFQIQNRCITEKLRFTQRFVNKWEVLLPHMVTSYAWDEPEVEKQITLNVLGDLAREYHFSFDDMGVVQDLELESPPRHLYVWMENDGPTKVLIVSGETGVDG